MHKYWWIPLLLVILIGGSGVLLMGVKTYQDAPPIADFVDERGGTIASRDLVLKGQVVFQKYNLMDYGSMFGDGANRGPDFTADALHQVALAMNRYYLANPTPTHAGLIDGDRKTLVSEQVKRDLKLNRHEPDKSRITLNAAQASGLTSLARHYAEMFAGEGPEAFKTNRYITDPEELRALSAFFFWGSWVCAAQRPGQGYSYTHNWPYDELAGNTATKQALLWSVIGLLGLIFVLGVVLFGYGRAEKMAGFQPPENTRPPVTPESAAAFMLWPTQRATYKFFAVAAALFVVQVLVGVLTIHDFLGFTTFFGVDISQYLPVTVTRAWHLVLALLWITVCWMGGSIFILPMIAKQEPQGQLTLVNALFGLLIVVTVGSMAGIFLGPMGFLGDLWRLLGNQGWEFVELGRLWQVGLLGSLILWAAIVWRGVRTALKPKIPWALPNWLLYAVTAVVVLFLSSFVATPETNFAIADFWRWMVIHMWAECFLEVFTTVVVAYFLVIMGLVSQASAVRVVYLATLLFLGSGILGISHNFYWNAKPVITMALGSIFSTLQVVPLIILTLEAWKAYRMPSDAMRNHQRAPGGARLRFGQSAAFTFLLGVNFWNFMGAGVFGLIINLPIVNYYQHGTYLTVNHGHTAFMGVYGNLSLAALAFCSRFLVRSERWNEGLFTIAFWSMNIGLALMALLHLFPAGVAQLLVVLHEGYAAGRSQVFIQSSLFQTMTWMRIVGGSIFVLGGVFPLAWFMVSRLRDVKSVGESDMGKGEILPDESLAERNPVPAGYRPG